MCNNKKNIWDATKKIDKEKYMINCVIKGGYEEIRKFKSSSVYVYLKQSLKNGSSKNWLRVTNNKIFGIE